MEVSARLLALEVTSVLEVCFAVWKHLAWSNLSPHAGYNIQGRQFGMAVDDVTSMQIVLATGEIVTASSTENHDLWWGHVGAERMESSSASRSTYKYSPDPPR